MLNNSFFSPGDHPLETCARFGKMNPTDFHLERLNTFLRWNREHFASFMKSRESDPENAERELHYLNDTIERGYEHLARLTELLQAGYQPTLNDQATVDEGRECAIVGGDIESNPYRYDPIRFIFWLKGFRTGQTHDPECPICHGTGTFKEGGDSEFRGYELQCDCNVAARRSV